MDNDKLERAVRGEARKARENQQRIKAAIQAAQEALRTVDTETVVKTFREAIIENARAQDPTVDPEVAQRHTNVIFGAYKELRRRGEEMAAMPLLDDPDLHVRNMTALFALPIATEKAERVLEEIASGPPSMARLGAKMTLERWRTTGVAVDLDE